MVKFREWLEQNWMLSVIIAAFILGQLVLIAAIWQKPLLWDSSIYIATGKYIYSMGEYGFWSALRGPGVPMIIGLFWKLGMPMLGYPRLVGLGVSAIGIGIFYTLTDRLFGRTEAIATAGIVAASHVYYFFTPEILTGIPSSILIFASLYMVTREKYFPAGVLAASAFLFRYPAALVGVAAVVFILARGIKRGDLRSSINSISRFATAVALIVVPYMLFLQFFEGSMLKPFLVSAGNTAAAGADYTAFAYYLVGAVRSNPLQIFLPVGLYAVFSDRDWNYGAFFSGLVVFYVFFGVFPLKLERYILPFLPVMAVFSARGLLELKERIDLEKIRIEWLLLAAIIAVMSYSFMTTFNAVTWENPDRRKFLGEVSTLEGRIATNDPATNLYADFSYQELPPPELSEIFEEERGEIDHWAINQCYWDCRGNRECLSSIEEFENRLNQRYGKSFEIRGDTCNYVIYSR